MAIRRKSKAREAQLAFEALTIEGGLLSPDWLARAAQLGAGSQSEADYRVPKGLNLRDEIGRYWRIAQANWSEFAAGKEGSADKRLVAERFVLALLRDSFGFASLAAVSPCEIGGRTYPIGFSALGQRVPVIIAPAASGLDTLVQEFGDAGRRRSAFGMAQEYLNAADGALWGLACDGVTLRMLRDNASLTRPAWIEIDLGRIFTEERYADFAALWLLAHETRFGRTDQPVTECALEAWRTAGREEGTRAREHLRQGVEEALIAFGQGFLSHPENQALRAALQDGSLSKTDYFQQLLRLVYRLIFLLTAEERGVLHPSDAKEPTKKLYEEGYSLRRLRERSTRRSAHDRFSDLWDSVRIVLRGLAGGEARLALPALAGLFAKDQCPALDGAKLENRALLVGVFRLSWLREKSGLSRVNWRDMGPEELGSVYEGLLELVPQVTEAGRKFAFATGGETKGNARKTTGSYYTPDSLVQVLLDSALEPVVKDTIARNPEEPVDALLQLSVVDPACGSGHFLLAAARRLAAHVARAQVNGTPSAAEYRHALRQVVGRCLYGVDLNPMAVELCKVSLWMEAVEPGLPLTFLDSHIRQGNALLGTTPELMAKGIPDAAWEPTEGDDKKTASALKKRNKAAAKGQRDMATLWSKPAQDEAQSIAYQVAQLDAASDSSVEDLAKKLAQWDGIRGSAAFEHQKFVADAWCAGFFWPKVAGEAADAAPTNELWRQIRDGQGSPPTLTRLKTDELARRYSFFHWHLAFPQIYERGGFDLVLGNPPWDTLSPDAKEFFSVLNPDIRSQSKAEQAKSIEALLDQPDVSEAWARYRRDIFVCAGFLRGSGRYSLFAPGNLGKGDFNLYRLFVEHALRNVRAGGWASQLVPDGLYSGANSMAIRKELFERFLLTSVLGFENTHETWFPGVHRQTKFALYSARRTEVPGKAFVAAFGIRTTDDLAQAPRNAMEFPIAMVREFSPDALAVMEFQSIADINIAKKMYGVWPPLGKLVAGTAHRSYLRELESGHVQKWLTEDRSCLPHYEGRMIAQYDYRAKGYRSGRARTAVWADLPFESPEKSVQPQWYVPVEGIPEQAKSRTREYRVGFCDVTSPTTDRTLVAAMLPPNCIAGDKVPTVMMVSGEPRADLLLWLGIANSFAMDYLARMKVSLKMALVVLDSLPFPRLAPDAPERVFLIPRVLRLVCTGPEMSALWDEMAQMGFVEHRGAGNDCPGTIDAESRLQLVAEIEGQIALLFGLSHEDLSRILDTFGMVRKYDEKACGEYRTKDVILKVYDEMVQAACTGKPYQTRLVPQRPDASIAHAPRKIGTLEPRKSWESLPDGAWTHLSSDGDTGAVLAAVLKAFGGATSMRRIRLAALLTLEPRLVTRFLEGERRAAWLRIVGDDAATLPSNVASLAQRVDSAWGDAVRQFRSTGLLNEDAAAKTWAPGPGIEALATSGWPDGRAEVAVTVVETCGEAEVTKVLPDSTRGWVDGKAA